MAKMGQKLIKSYFSTGIFLFFQANKHFWKASDWTFPLLNTQQVNKIICISPHNLRETLVAEQSLLNTVLKPWVVAEQHWLLNWGAAEFIFSYLNLKKKKLWLFFPFFLLGIFGGLNISSIQWMALNSILTHTCSLIMKKDHCHYVFGILKLVSFIKTSRHFFLSNLALFWKCSLDKIS